VAKGEARAAAEELAARIAAFPQVCMRSDRRSAYEQHGLALDAAIQNELRLGIPALQQEARGGAERFSDGAGRGGSF
jgi:enoyl-CoA hydratase